jgi:hypothetical protein
MIGRVLRFVRLPLLVMLLVAVGRFVLGAKGFPYAPRGNAMFSIVGVTWVSCVYFGALSRRRFSWGGTVVMAVILALWSQIIIFSATYLSYALGIETSYFRHWDALNVKEGVVVPMAQALRVRAGAFIAFPILCTVITSIGRLLGALAPDTTE